MEKIEELEQRIENLEKIIQSLQTEQSLNSDDKNTSKLQQLITNNFFNLSASDLIIILLYSQPAMTKDEIKIKFRSLGATNKMLNWFNGGNFKQRLIDKGIIFESGKKDNKSIFSLTMGKGNQIAEKIVQELKSS